MELSEIIKQRIKKNGPLSFHDFMEIALYYPALGYYTASQDQIGKNGDFFTSSSLTPVFGAVIGKQLEEMWHLTGEREFTVVEYGAGTGMLCHDILDYLKDNDKLYDRLHYVIIEKSPSMRAREKMHLHEKVSWYDTIGEVGSITGCIFSNELIDNFAVHEVVMEDELMEVFVDYRDDFAEVLKPADEPLKDYLAEFNMTLPKGFRTEINLEAKKWIAGVAASLTKGYVMTIDYGYTADKYYGPCRSEGTLLCYHQHQVNDKPYRNIGKQDITSHVNFSSLCRWGHQNGLTCCGTTTQAQFLLSLGFKDHLRKKAAANEDVVQLAMKEAMITHTLLLGMGSKFKVLIQQKGMQGQALLGLRG